MTKKYRHIIFDADHTLIDFNEDEKRAFRTALKGTAADSEEIISDLWQYSLDNWLELGLHRVHEKETQKNYHPLHYVHVHALFEYAQQKYALQNADEAEKIFFQALCLPSIERAGALETVKALAGRYFVSVATNGLFEMQRARLKEFTPYVTRLFISEEMNCIKPSEEYGKLLLEGLNAKAEECLFIGDSLNSDIALANKLRMDVVWYNPEGRPMPEGYAVVKEIRALKELLNFL